MTGFQNLAKISVMLKGYFIMKEDLQGRRYEMILSKQREK